MLEVAHCRVHNQKLKTELLTQRHYEKNSIWIIFWSVIPTLTFLLLAFVENKKILVAVDEGLINITE